MKMKKLLITSILTLSSITVSNAAIILNGDFETGAADNFNTNPATGVPNWLWDGLENAPTRNVTGDYGGGTDRFALGRGVESANGFGAIYQTTGEIIGAGTSYSMTAVAFNTFNQHDGELIARLYYLDGATRTYIAGAEDTYVGLVPEEYTTPGSLQIDYTGSGAAVGNPLGVEFSWENGTGNGSWQAVDNVAINIVPEPSSAVLLGLGGLALMLRRRK